MNVPSHDIEQLVRDIKFLKDVELIKRLKHRYFRCIDMANLDELAELLDENVTASLIGGSYRFELEGRERYIEAIRNGFHSQSVAKHNGHHPEIDIVSDTEATGIWYLSDVFLDFRNQVSTVGTALYHDEYIKVDGQWKIRHTRYERIYEIVEPITTRPNLTAHYLATHGHQFPEQA